jgi:hypothetical protein
MPAMEKMLPLSKKVWQYDYTIDALHMAFSGGTEFNIPQYAAFIDILVQKIQTTISYRTFTRR